MGQETPCTVLPSLPSTPLSLFVNSQIILAYLLHLFYLSLICEIPEKVLTLYAVGNYLVQCLPLKKIFRHLFTIKYLVWIQLKLTINSETTYIRDNKFFKIL